MIQNKRFLITGATGFIGSHLVEYFSQHNNQVVCGVRKDTKNLSRLKHIENLEFVEYSLRKPCRHLRSQLLNIDYILHVAANPSSEASLQDPIGAIFDNVVGTGYILELARELNLKRFVYYSTAEVFGPVTLGNDSKENDPYKSNNPYGATKAGGEELAVAYSSSFGIPTSVVHLNNSFGERCQSTRFPVTTIKKILNNEKLVIHTGADGHIGGRRWYYVKDVAEHTDFILQNQKSHCEKWNSAGAEFIDNLSFAKMIAQSLKKELHYELVPVDRPGHDAYNLVNPDKLYRGGYKNTSTTQEKIDNMVKWYLNNTQWLENVQ